MPTNEEMTVARSVSVLLEILANENTYQGMTDEEIQSIVDYKEHLAYQNGRTDEGAAMHAQYNSEMLRVTQQSLQAETDLLQSIVERASNPVLEVVQYG